MTEPIQARSLWLAVLLCGLVSLWGCPQVLECGAGTHQEGDECVPNIPQNCTSDNVVFRDGRCQPSPSVCAEGSKLDEETGLCIGTDEPPNNTPNNDPMDVGLEDAGEPDAPEGDVDEDAPEDVDDPDVPPPPSCGDSSPAGTVCVSGQVLNWATNTPLQTEETLAIILDDLQQRIQDPLKAPFGQSLLAPGGTFLLEEVDIQADTTPLQQMILIISALPDAETTAFQRTLTGVPAVVAEGQVYNGTPAFAVPAGLVALWSGLLGLEGEGSLGNVGFLLVRVLSNTDNGLVPVPGATLAHTDPQADAAAVKHYLADDLMSFREGDTTGAQGAVLIVSAPIGEYTAEAPGFFFGTTLGGSTAGIAITTAVIGVVE